MCTAMLEFDAGIDSIEYDMTGFRLPRKGEWSGLLSTYILSAKGFTVSVATTPG
jgi:hypothetical protein